MLVLMPFQACRSEPANPFTCCNAKALAVPRHLVGIANSKLRDNWVRIARFQAAFAAQFFPGSTDKAAPIAHPSGAAASTQGKLAARVAAFNVRQEAMCRRLDALEVRQAASQDSQGRMHQNSRSVPCMLLDVKVSTVVAVDWP